MHLLVAIDTEVLVEPFTLTTNTMLGSILLLRLCHLVRVKGRI